MADPFAGRVGELLRAGGRTVGVAESCSGGLLSAALTAPAGSSAWFLGGVVAYSNDLKVSLLGVPEDLLDRVGAVSSEVARAMATAARRLTAADIGIGMTGIAGPVLDQSAKPAGLLFVALLAEGPNGPVDQVWERRRCRGRAGNRADAAELGLRMITAFLAGELPAGSSARRLD